MNIDYEITKAHMLSSGWKLVDYADSNVFDSVFFYIVDFSLGLVKLITMKNTDVKKGLDKIKFLPLNSLVGGVSQMVLKWSSTGLENDELGQLGYTLVNYFSQTKTFRIYNQQFPQDNSHDNLHVVFNLYRQNRSEHISMRPFIIGQDCLVRSAKEIVHHARMVRHIDSQQRPNDQFLVTDGILLN
ncbi:hypothetical protein GCM10011607_11700 [Shewanella inventionis]|uniref:Uncharacterized protein n=1 Tax=Shewanella inventionis TaxID=1738770 RepID=A0ABQ1IXG8_9GAMM|nr:hypothetical protein [Shewanella inventionis]GGB52868.1 hypothetical protein GCM10011607_11700 [Shewanella inventionis]